MEHLRVPSGGMKRSQDGFPMQGKPTLHVLRPIEMNHT